MGACWPLGPDRRDHVDPSRPRPLPRQGPRPARDVRRADGARTQGTNRGRGGSMHIADPTIGIFGANGIVGAGLPDRGRVPRPRRSCGRDGSVAVAFFGDGAVAHGTFHEAVNLAAVWQLPVIFFCENNGYAEFSPASHAARGAARAARRGYGVDYVAVDGNDVVATATAMTVGRRSRARRTGTRRSSRPPPTAGTATTRATRSATDPPDEVREWEARDPLLVHARRLRSAGIADDALDAMQSSVARELDDAVEAARRLPGPAASTLTDFVARPRPERAEPPRTGGRCAGVPHDGRDPRRARSRARRRRARVRRRDRRRRRRQRLRAHARAARSRSAIASATRRSPRARSWASASARRWPACARSSS